MQRLLSNNFSRTIRFFAAAFFALFVVSMAAAQREAVLFSIQNGADGRNPYGPVVRDSAGNLYGTTVGGGGLNGAVWELSPSLGGTWTETVLHTFTGGPDGASPMGGLVLDSAGNLYGTASTGGNAGCSNQGCGVVFKLSPGGSGGWTDTVIYSFTGGSDGGTPWTSVTFDAAGNLYGTTVNGGNFGFGVVFELLPNSSGSWTESVLHHFTNGADGGTPFGTLLFDASGNLYGTTEGGGDPSCNSSWPNGCGIVFRLSPTSGGWKGTVLHTFHPAHGSQPQGGVIMDSAGNLYGATIVGGENFGCYGTGCGVVYKLSPTASGPWAFTQLHEFSDQKFNNGFMPMGNLLLDKSGVLYGTASQGGKCTGGLVYKLTQGSGGSWIETVLHPFACTTTDGFVPFSGLISDSAGNLYGTTTGGGSTDFNAGTVYELTP